MRAHVGACLLLLAGATAAGAQVKTDSVAADTSALARELRALTDKENAAAPQAQGPTNARLLPDISLVGDLVADLSPHRSSQEGGQRFSVREVELAVQAAVDPYFRGDVFLGISDEEGISIEQAFLTTSSLPAGLEARLGRYLIPFSKQNLTHRHDLHTVEYPHVIQRFLGPEGLKGTGIGLSKVIAPFGFYQELLVNAVELVDEESEDLIPDERASSDLDGLGFSARLRNYWDLSQSSNIELAASALTTERPQPAEFVSCLPSSTDDEACINAVNARQSTIGADLTFRWRPLEQGLYKSFILQAEVMRQLNASPDGPLLGFEYLGPTRDVTGAYIFARYQLTQRGYLGARADWVQDEASAELGAG
jgi:hypothetical protein